MKRLLSGLLVACMLFGLAGCGTNGTGDAPTDTVADAIISYDPIRIEGSSFILTPEQLKANINEQAGGEIITTDCTVYDGDTKRLYMYSEKDDITLTIFESLETEDISVIFVTQPVREHSDNSALQNASYDAMCMFLAGACNPGEQSETAKSEAVRLTTRSRAGLSAYGDTDYFECGDTMLVAQRKDGKDTFAVMVAASNSQATLGEVDTGQEDASAQNTETIGQKNALQAANGYLNVMPFSYSGLIKQLEYEGYSAEDATYAAENCGADWNKQAAKTAQGYIDTMSFSKSGLIDQLIYEGFTQEQAEYGVAAVGY